MNEIANMTDKIAKENDRWLMVALLIVCAIIVVVVWRFLVADREKLSKRLTEVTDRHIAVCEKVADVVATNTAVVHANTNLLVRVEKKL